jgi:hypothetical protein
MSAPESAPIHELPEGYREVQHLVLTSRWNYIVLNLLAFVPLLLALAGMAAWLTLVVKLRGSIAGGLGSDWPVWARFAVLLAILPIHEALHGVAIRWAGHKPRYGAKLTKLVLYATADNALFRRNEYLVVALTPIVGITIGGMLLVLIAPDSFGFYISLAVIFNAASAIGDLVQSAVLLRYPSSVLVLDEEDGMRIYAEQA